MPSSLPSTSTAPTAAPNPASSPVSSHRISAKAQDLLFGGNKSLSTRPASTSLPNTRPVSKRSSAVTQQSAAAGGDDAQGGGGGKVYDVLGESRQLIDVFRDQSKAFHMLGVLEDRAGGAEARKGKKTETGRHQHSRSLDGAQPLPEDSVTSSAGAGGLVSRVKTLLRSPSPSPSPTSASATATSPQPAPSPTSGSQPQPVPQLSSAPLSSAPLSPPAPFLSPSHAQPQLSAKARALLFGSGHRSKPLDRLGLTSAMMDLFSQQPKAFQRLGLFDSPLPLSDRRMNAHGVVISGMRQLLQGHLYLLREHGGGMVVMRRVVRKYFVLTLDALTWYTGEEDMVAEGEISLVHGAVVKKDREMLLERKAGILRSRRKTREEEEQEGEGKDDEAAAAAAQHEQEEKKTEEDRARTQQLLSPPAASTSSSSAASPAPASTTRQLYGFSVTPIRSITGDTRTYHLLTPSAATAQLWISTITTTLRKARSRAGVIVHNASRSSDMPGNLTYLHSRTHEGYLFRLSSSAPSLSSSSSQWLPRYCILSNTALSIFLSPEHTTPSARAQGKLPLFSLSLRECSVRRIDQDVGGGQGWVFELRGHRVHNHGEHHVHVFGCGGEEERAQWMRLLERAGWGGRGGQGGTREASWTDEVREESKDSEGGGRTGGAQAGAAGAGHHRGDRTGLTTPSSVGVSLSGVGPVMTDDCKREPDDCSETIQQQPASHDIIGTGSSSTHDQQAEQDTTAAAQPTPAMGDSRPAAASVHYFTTRQTGSSV